ncbi:MAG: RNA 2',3'-cyclic phosphodiesterase [Nitrospira sp. NTP1]|nr:RNA 2',3'-cyclic phosphodiesterase [Nitrospira sp. NTP1]
MIRAFLSVELPPDFRAALSAVQQDLKRRLEPTVGRQARISWVQPASMHLTVRFLGETPEDVIESLRMTLASAVAGHRPIQVPFSRLGTFPRPQQPRVLWAGPLESWEQGNEGARLQALSRMVEDLCRAAGLAAEERPLSPHLTLARIKEGERQVGQGLAQSGLLDQPVTIGVLPITTLVMMRSELRPAGPVYSPLWTCPLAAAQ